MNAAPWWFVLVTTISGALLAGGFALLGAWVNGRNARNLKHEELAQQRSLEREKLLHNRQVETFASLLTSSDKVWSTAQSVVVLIRGSSASQEKAVEAMAECKKAYTEYRGYNDILTLIATPDTVVKSLEHAQGIGELVQSILRALTEPSAGNKTAVELNDAWFRRTSHDLRMALRKELGIQPNSSVRTPQPKTSSPPQ